MLDTHHMWCNGHPGSPVTGCRWCDPVGRDGLWKLYPYEQAPCPVSEQEFCRHGNPEDKCDSCAEAIFDRWIADFYGGSTPQTLKEELEVAAAQKRIIG